MIAEPKPDFETFANKKLIDIWRVDLKNYICKGWWRSSFIIAIFSNFAIIAKINTPAMQNELSSIHW